MNQLMSKASLVEQRPGPTAGSSSQSTSIRKRGVPITLIVRKVFDAEGNRRPGSYSFEAATTENRLSPDQSVPAEKKPRKKRAKPYRPEDQPVPLEKLKWLTIPQTSLRYPSFSEKALRHLVAQAEAYAKHPKAGLRSNGFLPCVVRPAGQRKIVIDAEKFEEWLKSSSVASR